VNRGRDRLRAGLVVASKLPPIACLGYDRFQAGILPVARAINDQRRLRLCRRRTA
jgi:hypothetical protein